MQPNIFLLGYLAFWHNETCFIAKKISSSLTTFFIGNLSFCSLGTCYIGFYKVWLIFYFVVRTLKKVCNMSKELAQANLLGAYALSLTHNSKLLYLG